MKGRKESNALTFQKCSTHGAMHWPSRKVSLTQPCFDLPEKVPLTVMLWHSRKVPLTESRLNLPEMFHSQSHALTFQKGSTHSHVLTFQKGFTHSHVLTFQKGSTHRVTPWPSRKDSTHRALLWPSRNVPLTEPCADLPERFHSQNHVLTIQRGLSYRVMHSPSRKVPLTEVPLHRPAPLLASVNRKSRVFSSQCEILLSQQVMTSGKVELMERKAGWSYCGVKTKQTNTTKTKQK